MEFGPFDPIKSATNKAERGVDFIEAQAIWLDADRVEVPTKAGDDDERRFLVIGMLDNKVWTAVITYRDNQIRIISCHRASGKQERYYYSG